MKELIDSLRDWLLNQAIEDADLTETIGELGSRLVDAGLPVCRFTVGRGLAHPVIGLASFTWTSDQRQVEAEVTPPRQLNNEQVLATPFGYIALKGEVRMSAHLTDPEEVSRFPLFGKLAAEGISHYVGFGRRFTPTDIPPPTHHADLKGVVVSYCTKRKTGFYDSEIDGLEQLIPALCVCVRVAIDKVLVTELMARYLGRTTGGRVLTGQTTRGDGKAIECALFYSDMRNSVGLSQSNSMEQYLESLNGYFDCAAGAVLDHGGEILKFIGDGILAIFPIDDKIRPPERMCVTAVSAARDAFARLDGLNDARADDNLAPLSFGIALHVGTVIYGNVGTEQRLDFTATGPAVGLVSRCESLTKTLDQDILATESFARFASSGAQSAGNHSIRGFAEPIELFSYNR